MANSGSFTKNIGSYWRIVTEWTATQNISANASTIITKVYWQSTSSYGSISSSAPKTASVTINGNVESSTFYAGLSGVQKKLILTTSHIVPHDSEGKLIANFTVGLGLNLTLQGTYYRTPQSFETTSINSIQSKSTLATYPERYIFDNDLNVTWNRTNSNHKHSLRFFVETVANDNTWERIFFVENLNTSYSHTFTQAEKNAIIAQRYAGNANTVILLETFDENNNSLGTDRFEGVIEIPARNTINKGSDSAGTFKVGQSNAIVADGTLWDTKIDVYVGSTKVDTIPMFNGSTTWTPSVATWQSYFTSVEEIEVTFKIESYYNNQIIRSTSFDKPATLQKASLPPIWSTTTKPTVIDVSSQGTTLTGNNTKIIQNISSLRLQIPNGSVAGQAGATIAKYRVFVGSIYQGEVTANNSGTTTYNIGTKNLSGNQNVIVHAVDSYGNSSSTTIVVNFIPYTAPVISSNTIGRRNSYEGVIIGGIAGTYSPLNINGTNKNNLSSITFKYREKGATSWIQSNYIPTVSNGTYTTDSKLITGLLEDKAYEVQVVVTDTVGNATTLNVDVNIGVPIVFLDKDLRSIGFGKFPTSVNSIETAFSITSTSNIQGANVTANSNITAGSTITSNTIRANNTFYIGSIANFTYVSGNIKASHQLTDANNKPYWNGTNLEVQYSYVMTDNTANTPKQIDITFPTAFTSIPTVMVSVGVTASQNITECTVTNITTTGCTLYFNRTTTVSSANNRINWLAIAKN